MNNIGKYFFLIVFLVGNLYSLSSVTNYSWPIYPFTSQHQINGTFGECRSKTVNGVLIQRHHFHTGIDIAGSEGTEVKPTLSGKVSFIPDARDYIQTKTIVGDLTYYFEYHHLKNIPSTLVAGSSITERVTTLGYINDQKHLHYVHGGSGVTVRNPLIYLHPYIDEKDPVFSLNAVNVIEDIDATADDNYLICPYYTLQAGVKVDIIVYAHDEIQSFGENMGLYGFWLVIYDPSGTGLPAKSRFFKYWEGNYRPNPMLIYVPGSNTSNYIYNLSNNETTNSNWNTSNLSEGTYTITVYAYDIYETEESFGQVTIYCTEVSAYTTRYLSASAAESDYNYKEGEPNDNK
ncbi:MAG: M23 family metallopeptidase [Candidatus Marinimicrobia bacterium]|jgi:hypothetical protein|nr:M23 family metallopeptidase [Candidatus Neomarinimicrobiota bacterium]